MVTTDFFGFDTSDNHYKLQGLGDVSEMGDAVLGLVVSADGRERAALARGPQRVGSADQGRRHTQAAGSNWRPRSKRLRPLEHGVQRDHLLGQHRSRITRLGAEPNR